MSRALLALAWLLCAACSQSESEPPARLPDVLVITIDTLRADHLGCYGYFRDTSPNLDALAQECVLFERCLTPVSQTLPTHTSLFTGLYPYEHGILANRKQARIYAPATRVRTFAEAMADAGYETAAIVSAEPVKREGGLAIGFEHWWEPEDKHVTADVVVERAMAWLERPRERPSFLWLHLFDPHATYDPPPPYDTMFVADEALDTHLATLRTSGRGRLYGPVEAHNLYDGEIGYTDLQLARLFDHLRDGGRWDEQVLVLTSDHGEGLGQHGSPGHEHIWLEQLSVPFLLKAPGLAPGRADQLLGTQDILPTAVARVPALAERLTPWLEQATGRDVLASQAEPRAVLAQFPWNRKPVLHAITRGRWRLILTPKRGRLYDLEQDPYELRDLSESRPQVAAALEAALKEQIRVQQARGEMFGAGGMRDLSEERRTGLEGLGYGGGDEDE